MQECVGVAQCGANTTPKTSSEIISVRRMVFVSMMGLVKDVRLIRPSTSQRTFSGCYKCVGQTPCWQDGPSFDIGFAVWRTVHRL